MGPFPNLSFTFYSVNREQDTTVSCESLAALLFTGLTYQELEDIVEGEPHIVVIWK